MTAVAISAGARMNSCADTSTRPRPKRSRVGRIDAEAALHALAAHHHVRRLPAGAACAAFTNAAASAWARASDWMRSPAGMFAGNQARALRVLGSRFTCGKAHGHAAGTPGHVRHHVRIAGFDADHLSQPRALSARAGARDGRA